MPIPFPIITDSVHGDVPDGFYPASDSDRGQVLVKTPGLAVKANITDCTEIRELKTWNGYLYAVAVKGGESILCRVNPVSGTFAQVGTVLTSTNGPAWIKTNLTQMAVCDGTTYYIYTPSTGSFMEMADPAFVGAGGFDYQDGYGFFFKPNSREWYITDLDDFTGMDATQVYVKQTQTDNIIGLLSHRRQPIIFGAETTEFYHNTGGTDTSGETATFERDAGGLISFGCGAPKTISDLTGAGVIWLSDQGQVVFAQGYSPTIVSNQMIEREIQTYSLFSDAIAFSYKSPGHIFYVLTFPTAGVTWVWDFVTKVWHKRSSYGVNNSFGRWRANCIALLNNKYYVGDFENGNIYEMSSEYLDDDGNEIQRIIYSPNFDNGSALIFHKPIHLLVKTGVGTFTHDPAVMLQLSNDNGNT
jgi:hypothetical protein